MEAVTNVTRHAHAATCQVDLAAGQDLVVDVTDDGTGMLPGSREGVGLSSMRRRAEELGGELHIAADAHGRGTVVTATLPLTAPAPTVPPMRQAGP